MDWRNESIWELRNLEAMRASIPNQQEEIRAVRGDMAAIRSAVSDSTPVFGGGNGREDMLLNAITKLDLLHANLRLTVMQVHMVDQALSFLSAEEKDILTRRYIAKKRDSVLDLCDIYGVSESTVKRRARSALIAYTMRRRGRLTI